MIRRALAVVALVLLALLPVASANDVWFYQGGEPGIAVSIANASIAEAATAGGAIPIDTQAPLSLSISLAPPPETTWVVRNVSVGLLLRGPGTTPPSSLVKQSNASATIPPGYTVVVNRTIDLGPVAKLGAGTFLMQAEVRDANDSQLYLQAFYVRIPVSAAALLTAQGAAITAISAATGYGLWSIAKDAKEARDAWDRHRKRRARARLDIIGRAEDAMEHAAAKAGSALAAIVETHKDAQEKERGLGPVRWAATGLGLGGVAMAWGQFLGLIALDVTGLLVTAMEIGATFLTVALIVNALLRRRRAALAQTRTLVPEGPPASPESEALAVDASQTVHPADKRG